MALVTNPPGATERIFGLMPQNSAVPCPGKWGTRWGPIETEACIRNKNVRRSSYLFGWLPEKRLTAYSTQELMLLPGNNFFLLASPDTLLFYQQHSTAQKEGERERERERLMYSSSTPNRLFPPQTMALAVPP